MPTLASFGSGVSFNLWGEKKKKTKIKDGASHTWNQSCSSTCGMVILHSGKTTSIFVIMSFAPSMSDTPWICATKKNHQTTEWTKFQPHKHINFLVSIQFNLIAKITTHTPLSSSHLPPSWLWKPFSSTDQRPNSSSTTIQKSQKIGQKKHNGNHLPWDCTVLLFCEWNNIPHLTGSC